MPRLAIALAALCVTRTASAQSIAIDEYRPAIDSRGYLTLNASQVLDHMDMSFGLGSLQWGRNLLAFHNGDAFYSVDNMISATLIAAFGVHVGVPLELGASLPFTIMNGSRGPDRSAIRAIRTTTSSTGSTAKASATSGSISKRGSRAPDRFGFGALASVYIPTGSSRDPFPRRGGGHAAADGHRRRDVRSPPPRRQRRHSAAPHDHVHGHGRRRRAGDDGLDHDLDRPAGRHRSRVRPRSPKRSSLSVRCSARSRSASITATSRSKRSAA